MIKKLEKLERILKNYNMFNFILEESINLKNEYSVMDYNKTIEHIENIKKEGRKLKIGIIGKVKAGKSSLLNAMIFNGEDILPKAATPMTAALTILGYGEEFKFTIEYYNDDDIKDMKDLHNIYFQKLEENKLTILEEEKEKAQKRNQTIDNEKIIKKARNKTNELGEIYQSSYEQYEEIKKSGIDLNKYLGLKEEIIANGLTDLQNKLNEYVGSKGKYTPLVKLSRIELPYESLKDLEIVDTPGVNDPIVSREERTKKMLKDCDVIFMITASGASLPESDISLLDRVESKKGIKNVYIVISKIDNSFTNDSDDLDEQLNILKIKMKERKDKVIDSNFNFKSIVKGDVVLTAGFVYSIAKCIKENKILSNEMNFTLNRLRTLFPDYLPNNNDKVLYDNLMKIANIDELNAISEEVRKQKEIIQEEKNIEIINIINKNISSYISQLNSYLISKKDEVENGDLNKIKKDYDNLNKQKNSIERDFNTEFKEVVIDLKLNIKKRFSRIIQTKVNEISAEISGAKSIKEGTRTVDKKGVGNWIARKVWGGGTEEVSYSYNTINTGPIKSRLIMLTKTIQNELEIEYLELTQNWKKNVSRMLVEVLNDNLELEQINEREVKSIISNVVSKVEIPKIFEKENLPAILNQSGVLPSIVADMYESAAYNYIAEFNNKYSEKTNKILLELDKKILNSNPIDGLIKNLESNLSNLIEIINNKESSLKNLTNLINDMKELS